MPLKKENGGPKPGGESSRAKETKPNKVDTEETTMRSNPSNVSNLHGLGRRQLKAAQPGNPVSRHGNAHKGRSPSRFLRIQGIHWPGLWPGGREHPDDGASRLPYSLGDLVVEAQTGRASSASTHHSTDQRAFAWLLEETLTQRGRLQFVSIVPPHHHKLSPSLSRVSKMGREPPLLTGSQA